MTEALYYLYKTETNELEKENIKKQINTLLIDNIENIENYSECELYILLDKCISTTKISDQEKTRNTLELLIIIISKFTNNITEWYNNWNNTINGLDTSLYREFIKSRITNININIFKVNNDIENIVYFDSNSNISNSTWLDNYLKEQNNEKSKTYQLG